MTNPNRTVIILIYKILKLEDKIMKIRTDFVTNSSSSSFVLARKGELSNELKDCIINFVLQEMLGERIRMLTPDSTEEDIEEFFDEGYIYLEDEMERVRKALKEGKTIYGGWVNFECRNSCADLLEDLWNQMEKYGGNEFEVIDGDLSY